MSTTAETAMSNGFQSRPEGEPASTSGASDATVQLVLDVVGPEVQRLVQSRARSSSGHLGYLLFGTPFLPSRRFQETEVISNG